MTLTSSRALELSRIQKLRKFAISIALIGLVAFAAVSQSIGGIDGGWHESIEAVGLAAIVLSIVGRAWCTLYIGGRKKVEIVDQGPYSISRNPLYFFSFVGAFGVGAQSGSLVIAAAFLAAALLVFHFTVQREEAFLLREFGEAYVRYRARTPRFWPRFSLWRDADELIVRPSLFLRTIRDGLVFLVAIPVFEMIDVGQAMQVLGVEIYLP